MNDSFGLAAFRSRTQVLRMEDALHRAGLSAGVIATPREVAIGCGLSVRFDLAQTPQVMQVYRRLSPGALIGFYRVEGYGTRRLKSRLESVLPLVFQSKKPPIRVQADRRHTFYLRFFAYSFKIQHIEGQSPWTEKNKTA